MKVTARKGYMKISAAGAKPVVAKAVGGRVHVSLDGMVAMPDAQQALGLLRSQVGVSKEDFDVAFGHMLPKTAKKSSRRGALRKNARTVKVRIVVAPGHLEIIDRKTDELLVLMDEDRHPETGEPVVMIGTDLEGRPPRWKSATAAARYWEELGYSPETFGAAFGKLLAAESRVRSRRARRRTSRRA